MLTIITLEILNTGKNSKNRLSLKSDDVHKADTLKKSDEEQSRDDIKKFENFIELLPILILALGIIIMYILGKIYTE